ncbi:SPL8 [Scenedesmus sp. PABB004]|nr:SPL8 [Scenedesmus sp. PABB004]
MARHQRRRHRCRAAGCAADLAAAGGAYSARKRLCPVHLKAAAMRCRDAAGLWRFCQQHGRLEPLESFDGHRRSCRASLERRALRAKGAEGGPPAPAHAAAAVVLAKAFCAAEQRAAEELQLELELEVEIEMEIEMELRAAGLVIAPGGVVAAPPAAALPPPPPPPPPPLPAARAEPDGAARLARLAAQAHKAHGVLADLSRALPAAAATGQPPVLPDAATRLARLAAQVREMRGAVADLARLYPAAAAAASQPLPPRSGEPGGRGAGSGDSASSSPRWNSV